MYASLSRIFRSMVFGAVGSLAACGSRTDIPVDRTMQSPNDPAAGSDPARFCTFALTNAANCSSVIKVSPGTWACNVGSTSSDALCNAACGQDVPCAILDGTSVICDECHRRPLRR